MIPLFLQDLLRPRSDGRAVPIDPVKQAASIMGKAGNAARRSREQAKIIAKANEMRRALGLEPIT